MKLRTIAAVAAVTILTTTAAYAQANIGGGGGGGLGDTLVQWVFQSFIHSLAAAGLLALLIGALVMRSHLMHFMVAGMALIAIANYTAILGVVGL